MIINKIGDILFSYLTPLIKRIKNGKDKVLNKDFEEYVKSEVKTENMIKKIQKFKQENNLSKAQTCNLLSFFYSITGRSYSIGFLMFLGKDLIAALGIFLMDQITDLLKEDDINSDGIKLNISILLISIFLIFLIKSALFSQYEWYQCIWKMQAKTLLSYLIYEKSLKIQQISNILNQEEYKQKQEVDQNNQSNNQNENHSENEENSIPDLNNLMTTDVEEMQEAYWVFIELICGLSIIGVILGLIYYRIGDNMIEGMYILFIAIILNSFSSYILSVYFYFFFILFLFGDIFKNYLIYFTDINQKQYDQLESWIDKRVSLSKDVFEGIKSIKYLGWENIFENKILNIRKSEFRYIKTTKSIDCLHQIFWNCVCYFMLYSFLSNFINQESGKNLKDSNVFTIIALFGYIQHPLLKLPWCFSYVSHLKISYKRIKKYLDEKEVDYSQCNF